MKPKKFNKKILWDSFRFVTMINLAEFELKRNQYLMRSLKSILVQFPIFSFLIFCASLF